MLASMLSSMVLHSMNDVSFALNKYGLELLGKQKPDEAAPFFLEAVERNPRNADAYTNLGVALFLQDKLDEALAIYQQALILQPYNAETLLNISFVLWKNGEIEGAKARMAEAAKLGLAGAHFALGKILRESGDNEPAIRHLREGLRIDPDDLSARAALREALHHNGDQLAALEQCDEMIRREPNHPLHPFRKACVMLTYDNPAGWQQYEYRYEVSSDTLTRAGKGDPKLFADLITKRWDGQPTGHLLVHREQGFGDNIQMLRFIPYAAQRCEKMSLFVPPTLRRLTKAALRDCPNVTVVDDLLCPKEFDHWCLLMSMPYMLGMTRDFPTAPYFEAPKEQYGEVRELKGLKVGIAWEGNKGHEDDRWRRIPFETMTKLFAVPATFVSLHFPTEVDKGDYPLIEVYPTPSSYFGHLMIDWAETAALIDALDLVISADTAVVHMAGALGKPVWLLNRHNTDWRWGLHRNDSPWYPSMRIFRQPRLGDWDAVLDEAVDALRQLV